MERLHHLPACSFTRWVMRQFASESHSRDDSTEMRWSPLGTGTALSLRVARSGRSALIAAYPAIRSCAITAHVSHSFPLQAPRDAERPA
jgi:hypothetical protein